MNLLSPLPDHEGGCVWPQFQEAVTGHAQDILRVTAPKLWMSRHFMPPTRDMSASRRTLLQAWCRKVHPAVPAKVYRSETTGKGTTMHRAFAIGMAAVLLLLVGGGPARAGNEGDTLVAPSVNDMRLKVSPNGRYFVDQDGKPFFYLADTCWLLFQRLDHDELDEYLKDRAAKGFTVIQAYVIRGLDQRHPDGNSSLLGESPFIDRDPTKPNEAYFRNMDYAVNRANELGLVMGLVTSKSWHVNKTPEQVFDEKNAYTFGKFLGERYKNNAVHLVSGRRLRPRAGRLGLGGDGEGAPGRQRRYAIDLLPRLRPDVLLHLVSQR